MSEQTAGFFVPTISRAPVRPWLVVARHVALMLEARRTRRILAEMDPRLMKDIGIGRAEAAREVARPFWDYLPRR